MIVLSGDIGGTNTRLQLTEFVADTTKIIKTTRYNNNEYSSLIDVIDIFLADIDAKDSRIESACFGVAGPIINETVKVTNLPWIITADVIKRQLKLDKVALLNDFVAIGYGLEMVQPFDLCTLQVGRPCIDGIKAYIGAGTGLGMGFIIYQGKSKVYPTEGGHIDFAPTDEIQSELLGFMRKKYHRVSLERVLSGQGLIDIYLFVNENKKLGEAEEQKLAALIENDQRVDIAATITEHAVKNCNTLAVRALDIFIKIYGTAAGNLALTSLPFGGLYIVGGIAPKLLPQIKNWQFLHAFRDKGRMENLVQDIPLHVVLDTSVGLKGATMYAKNIGYNG